MADDDYDDDRYWERDWERVQETITLKIEATTSPFIDPTPTHTTMVRDLPHTVSSACHRHFLLPVLFVSLLTPFMFLPVSILDLNLNLMLLARTRLR